MNRLLLGLKKAGTVAVQVAESPVVETAVETLVPEIWPGISIAETILKEKGATMDFESLGIMLAVQALNTYIKNPKKNSAVTAQLETVCTDLLEDLGYTVTAPSMPKLGAAATTS